MFANEKVCEIALIISGSTDYEFSADNFIELSESLREVFTIIIDALVYIMARKW